MRRNCLGLALLCVFALGSSPALATNGDNFMAIGPIARAMGGVGIAAPQDAISAVFANPAAMCFSPYCPSSEVDFSGTLFMPHVEGKVTTGGQTFSADSESNVFAVPAMGISVPLSDKSPYWRFGFGAYGATGLGADFRDSELDQPSFFGPNVPLIAGEFTLLQVMKFSPAIAFQPYDRLSLGLALHIDYATLDLRNGSSPGYGVGAQVGAIYQLKDNISLGFNFVSPQEVTHENVLRNAAGQFDLELESPMQFGVGVSYTTLEGKLLLETDLKWLNWADAAGYGDFDWENQWVVAVGAQYKPINKLALRLGYNFGNNPVNEHRINGANLVTVQGITLPSYYLETFRVLGFPALVEHHATAGIGYEFSPKFAVNLAYTHAFENTLTETGQNLAGQFTRLESSLSEDSLELGITWRF